MLDLSSQLRDVDTSSEAVQHFFSGVNEMCNMNEVQWHWESKVPYAEMPSDDRIWYPPFLKGNAFITGTFCFADEVLLKHDMRLKFYN